MVRTSMMFSNVIVDIAFPPRSFVFNQSSCEVSASLTDVGGMAVGTIDLISYSLFVPGFVFVFDVRQRLASCSFTSFFSAIAFSCSPYGRIISLLAGPMKFISSKIVIIFSLSPSPIKYQLPLFSPPQQGSLVHHNLFYYYYEKKESSI